MKVTPERLGTALVVVGILAAALSLVISNSQEAASPDSQPPTSVSSPTASPEPSPTATKHAEEDELEGDSVERVQLDAAIMATIAEAVQIWAAYPNPEGREATLAKLRLNGSLTGSALQFVAIQWATTPTEPVKVTASELVLMPPALLSTLRASLEGGVTLSQHYSDGKVTPLRIRIDVQLEQSDGIWQISRLVIP